MAVHEVDIFAENSVINVCRHFVSVSILFGCTQSVFKRLHTVIAPSLVIRVIHNLSIGGNTEITQRKVVVQALEGKHSLVVIIPKSILVKLSVTECTHTAELHLAVAVWVGREEHERSLVHGEPDGRVIPHHARTSCD